MSLRFDDWLAAVEYEGSNDSSAICPPLFVSLNSLGEFEMIHGSQTSQRIQPWTFTYKGYDKVCRSFFVRGYETIDALCEPYDDKRQVVVHEIQNISTLTCFWLCYLVGRGGGVFHTPVTRVNPQRMDLTLHAMPSEGLHFRKCVREADLESLIIPIEW